MKNLFLLSFNERDPLAAKISGFGWRVSSARRSQDLEDRFLASNALIAVIDLRKAEIEGLTAIMDLSEVINGSGIALLALGDQHEQPRIAEKCYEAGATHFLDMFNVDADLRQSLNFAYRYAEHMRGGDEKLKHFRLLLEESDLKWSFRPSDLSSAEVSGSLKQSLPSVNFTHYPVTGIYRSLDEDAQKRVRGAMGRIKDGSPQAAVPHELNGKKVIHHLHVADGTVSGRIEFVDKADRTSNWTETDLLSGLRNAAAARSWIAEKLEDGRKLFLASVGLKNFRTINVAYGRTMGDQVLRIVGQRLLTEAGIFLAEDIIVSRIDGQNFLLATVWNKSPEKFTEFVMDLLDAIGQSVTIEERTIQLLPRIGFSGGEQTTNASAVIRRSSLALAEAMASDTVRIKASQKSTKAVELEHRLESELQEAINRQEIVIALQPQIRIGTGQLTGAEALARWNHPEFGILGAATLFAVADRAGLMELLSSHIHQRALAIASTWPESLSFLRLSINVTAGDLAHHQFATRLMNEIRKSKFRPDRLTLEITESELISDMKGSVERLKNLRNNGLKIAIDDFGTGYSSLAYLKDLPLDYLKIDSGLTSDIGGSEKDQVVVRSIIDMAKSLNLEVIAEGVETETQLEKLTSQDCDYFQGFLRSGPLTPDEFEVFALRSD